MVYPKLAIIGAGSILPAHARGLLKMKDQCAVVAVAKEHPERADDVRALFGDGVRIVKDYRDVLAMDEVNAVDILLPHDLHMEATVAAAKARKHVMVEKVMARNIYECDRMIEACEAAGVTLAVAHDRRYDPRWMALKQVVSSGVLGEIHFWRLEHNQDVSLPLGHWVRSRDRLGGGAIMSCLTHQIDALRWYAGEVESVACMSKIAPERMEGETAGAVLAKMKSGTLAQATINWATRCGGGPPNGLWAEFNHVTGSRGEAYYMVGRGTYLMLYDEPERGAEFAEDGRLAPNVFAKVKSGAWEKHERCIGEWIKMLRGEPADLSTTGRDARSTVEVAEAACISEQTGRTVHLPIEPKPWGTR